MVARASGAGSLELIPGAPIGAPPPLAPGLAPARTHRWGPGGADILITAGPALRLFPASPPWATEADRARLLAGPTLCN